MAETKALAKLHTAMLDTRKGYEAAAKDAEEPALKQLFQDMVNLRTKDHDELHDVLVRLGVTPDDETSFMATVHETVIGARAAIKGIDRDSLSSFGNGEERILESYDAALDEQASKPDVVELLQRQKAAVQGKIEEMKRLANRSS